MEAVKLNDEETKLSSLEELALERRNLVFGAAGMGKSSLCRFLCQEWACDRAWQKKPFDCVIYVNLLDEFAAPSVASTEVDVIQSVVFNRDKLKRVHARWFWLWSRKRTVLWMLDGYDEVEHLIRGTVFSRLWDGSFPDSDASHVLVTARPSIACAGDERIQQSKYQCYQLEGFKESDIRDYASFYFERRAGGLPLDCKWVKEMGRTPLMLELLCFAYDQDEGLGEQSQHLSKAALFEKVLSLQLYLSGYKHRWWDKDSKRGGVLEEAKDALCEAGWRSFFQGRGYVKESELSHKGRQYVVESGLLRKVKADEEAWMWNHFSLQEFVAAKWACVQCCDKLAAVRQKMGPKSNMFFAFVCGVGGKAFDCLHQWYPCEEIAKQLSRVDEAVKGGLSREAIQGRWKDVEEEPLSWLEEDAGGGRLAPTLARHWKDLGTRYGSLLMDLATRRGWNEAIKFLVLHFNQYLRVRKYFHKVVCPNADVAMARWIFANVKYKKDFWVSSLCIACAHGSSVEMLEFLVKEAGADVNARSDGLTPLGCVTESYCDTQVISWLVEHGADVNCGYHSPLVGALQNDNFDYESLLPILNCLREHGASVNVVDQNGCSPLCKAFCPKALQWLADRGANCSNPCQGSSPLHHAVAADNAAVLEWWIEKYSSLCKEWSKKCQTPLDLVTSDTSEQVIRLLKRIEKC